MQDLSRMYDPNYKARELNRDYELIPRRTALSINPGTIYDISIPKEILECLRSRSVTV